MPKTSKISKVKKVSPAKKKPVTKVKASPVKVKKIVKKKKAAPKNPNKILVDIISDDDNQNLLPGTEMSFSKTATSFNVDDNELEISKEASSIFSSWSDFSKNSQAEDILEETDNDDLEETAQTNEDYDKQKKFFSDWAKQNTPKDGQENVSLAPNKKSIGLYKRQAFFYLAATVILLLAVVYFFFIRLTIYISPEGEKINDSISFNLVENTSTQISSEDTGNKIINGSLQIKEVSAEKNYQTSAEEVNTSAAEVSGQVTLINKYNKNQTLIATTRLLSSDGKLFRLKETVTIPMGSQVIADVYADKPGIDMEITQDTRFTIPGLWAGIQDKIYAESLGKLTYQTKVVKIVKAADLNNAKKDIDEVLTLKIKNELQATSSDTIVIYSDLEDSLNISYDVKLGDEKSEFKVSAKKQVIVATFPKNKALELAQARLSMIISDDKQLSDFDANKITYTLENFDQKTKTAEIKAYFSGVMSLKSDSSLIDRKKLVSLNEKQISQYLDTFPEIRDYKLEFWPSFIRTAPQLPDKIEIKINK